MDDPLNTLLLKYARIQDIPLRELEGVGWTREALSLEAGGGYRLVLLGKEGQDINTVKSPVFDTLEWSVTREELGFGRLERNRFTKVKRSLYNLDGERDFLNWEKDLNNDDHWLSQGFPHFIKPFTQYMGRVFNDDTQYILSLLIKTPITISDLSHFGYFRAVIDILGTDLELADAELPTKDKVEAAYYEPNFAT